MDATHAGPRDERTHVVRPDAAAGKDRDAGTGLVVQAPQGIGAVECAGRSSAGQHLVDAERHQRAQAFRRIRRDVEGAVADDAQSLREGDELAHPLDVEPAVLAQHTEHHAAGPSRAQLRDVAAHLRELGAVVHEVAGARSEHRVDGNPPRLCDLGERIQCGREAAIARAAEFEPVRAGSHRRVGFGNGLHVGLDERAR